MTELSRTVGLVDSYLSEVEALDTNVKADSIDPKDIGKLKEIRDDLVNIEGLIGKFRRRCAEKDVVTGELKVGGRYRKRVDELCTKFDRLREIIGRVLEASLGIEQTYLAAKEEEDKRRAAERVRLAEAEKIKLMALEQERIRLRKIALEEEKIEHEKRLKEAQKAVVGEGSEEKRNFNRDKKIMDEFLSDANGFVAQTESAVVASLELLKDAGNISEVFRKRQVAAIEELHTLFSRIVARPESDACRQINGMNCDFRKSIATVPGALEFMAATGWTVHLENEERDEEIVQHLKYRLHEPDISKTPDDWVTWFDFIKTVPMFLKPDES